MIFVIITSTIGGLQIFAEPRLFDETNARNGGSDRQFGTITMLIYDFGWQLRDLGPRLGDRLDAVPDDLRLRARQPPAHPPHRQPGRRTMSRRPGFLVYGLLAAFLLGSAAPLYWSFLLGSHTAEIAAQGVPPLLPGWPLPRQRPARHRHHPVLEGRRQQPPGLVGDRVLGGVLRTLAGYAFAKLRFRGSNGLLVFVVSRRWRCPPSSAWSRCSS